MTLEQQAINFVKDFPEANLTGSRYFGTADKLSDWDFFMEHSEDTEKKLQSRGFWKVYESVYTDSSIVCLYQMPVGEKYIDVQLIKDVPLKLEAQKIITDLPIPLKICFERSTKSIKSELWNWALNMAAKCIKKN